MCFTKWVIKWLKSDDIFQQRFIFLQYSFLYFVHVVVVVVAVAVAVSTDNHSIGTRHNSLLYQLPTKTSTDRLCIRNNLPAVVLSKTVCFKIKCDVFLLVAPMHQQLTTPGMVSSLSHFVSHQSEAQW